jgi:hypothetical protein
VTHSSTRARVGRTFLTAGALLAMTATMGVTQASAGTSGSAAVASCISGAWKYDKPSGLGYAPAGAGYYVTTDRCADIQVKPDNATLMTLCWLKDRNDTDSDVCKDEVDVRPGKWTILGTGFRDGTYFYFKFANKGAHKTGLVAG